MALAIGSITPWVADSSVEHPTVATLKAAGCVGIIRYIDPGRNDGTEITPAEIADYHANSFPYGLVMEYSADWLEGGYNVGHADGLAALAEEQKLGIPDGVTYLACDFDIQPAQYQPAYACLQGFADARGGWQHVGVYGSKAFCEWVGAGGAVQHFWSTDAWSNFTPASNADLHQHANWPAGVPVVPGCDHNLILGDWAPRNTATDWLDMASLADVQTALRSVLNEGTPAGQPNWAAGNKAVLSTIQGVANKVSTIVGACNIVISGGNGHQGLDQIVAMLTEVEAELKSLTPASTGTVDLQPVLDKISSLTLKAS